MIMQLIRRYLSDKFLRIEIAFFLFYYFLFGLLTDIEYKLTEPPIPAYLNHGRGISVHFVNGIITIIPVWILYKVIIQKYLFKKRYLQFFLLLILYLVLLNFYNVYINWLVSKLSFLPVDIRDSATGKYHAKVLVHFGGTMYMIREYMVLFALAYFIKSAKQEKQMNELKQQQLNAELKYLKVQLQPHFFFNTLNNIYALTLRRSEKAAPLVARHSEMMRYILYNSPNQAVGLQQEIDFLKNYTEVEAIRYSDKINISFETQGIDNTMAIEPLLLLPFIENTFKHGIREEVNSGYVNIVICLVENELTLETKNSKAPAESIDNNTGVGLENVAKRLDILYPDSHLLEITEDDASYEVRLTLKLRANG
jgi:sensor histidine kinase YesM